MANTNPPGNRDLRTAGQQADEAKSHLQQAGSHAKDAASSAASGVAQKAQDAASGIGQSVKDAASAVSHKASDLASAAEGKTDDALSSVGHRMSSMAGTLRQSAPREGMMGSAASSVADTLDSGGHYLQEHGVGEITDDLAKVIRKHPVPSLAIAFGVGFLIGMGARR